MVKKYIIEESELCKLLKLLSNKFGKVDPDECDYKSFTAILNIETMNIDVTMHVSDIVYNEKEGFGIESITKRFEFPIKLYKKDMQQREFEECFNCPHHHIGGFCDIEGNCQAEINADEKFRRDELRNER